jgi:hypothetical protein
MYRYHLSRRGLKYAEWLKKGRIAEDLAYVKLTGEVLSYLPDELKNRLAMQSLWRSAEKSVGPRRSLNLLESNAVLVICLSITNSKLLGEKEKLELLNLVEKIGRERDLTSFQEQITAFVVAVAYVTVLAGANKNSAESWRTACIETWKLLSTAAGLPTDSVPFNKDVAPKPPPFDSRPHSHTHDSRSPGSSRGESTTERQLPGKRHTDQDASYIPSRSRLNTQKH